jgi:hypothetical protein
LPQVRIVVDDLLQAKVVGKHGRVHRGGQREPAAMLARELVENRLLAARADRADDALAGLQRVDQRRHAPRSTACTLSTRGR